MVIGVTGSSGYIGSHLVPRLVKKYRIVPMDRKGSVPDVDLVIDMAAYGVTRDKRDKAAPVYEANVTRLANLLDNLSGRDIPLIYFSSIAVNEKPYNFYSLSKRSAEDLVNLFVDQHGLIAKVIKPPRVVLSKPDIPVEYVYMDKFVDTVITMVDDFIKET